MSDEEKEGKDASPMIWAGGRPEITLQCVERVICMSQMGHYPVFRVSASVLMCDPNALRCHSFLLKAQSQQTAWCHWA